MCMECAHVLQLAASAGACYLPFLLRRLKGQRRARPAIVETKEGPADGISTRDN